MQPIDHHHLSHVRGGFLGALLGAAGPILNGVAGIIGASKSGGGGAAPPAAAATAQAAAPSMAPPAPPPSIDPGGGGGGSGVSISVSINGVRQR